MKIIVLGATGMIGHKLIQRLEKNHEVIPVSRRHAPYLKSAGILKSEIKVLSEPYDEREYEALILTSRPDVVINCIGVIKQKKQEESYRQQIYLNALFPHVLSDFCLKAGSKLLHISTDCVFSGDEGAYTEQHFSDARELYGRTKYLGEVAEPHVITLRTSAIGHELRTNYSLVEWFLSQQKGSVVYGYTKAIYSGFPTACLAALIEKILMEQPDMSGIYHLSSNPVSKYELLTLVADIYNVDIQIIPDDTFVCDRSLNSEKLQSILNYEPRSWKTMVEMMFEDFVATGYERLRKKIK